MAKYGDMLEENQTDIDNPMLFGLDPGIKQKMIETRGKDDSPMWSALLSVDMGGFYGLE